MKCMGESLSKARRYHRIGRFLFASFYMKAVLCSLLSRSCIHFSQIINENDSQIH